MSWNDDAPRLGENELTPVDLEALEAALALLDDCEPGSLIDSSVEVSTALSVDASSNLQVGGETSLDAGATDKKPRKRVREYSAETERLRRQRKRIERQELERQAEQLEQQLATIKERDQSLHIGLSKAEVVVDWRRDQERAQELNGQLRAALAAHGDVRECVHRLLSLLSKSTDETLKDAEKRAQAESVQTLTRPSVLFSSSSPHVDLSRAARSIQQASRLAMDSVFGSISSLELSKATRVRPLDGGGAGSCVEVTLTTPLNCDLQGGIKLIRDWIVAKRYRNVHSVSYSSLAVQTDDRLTEARSNVTFDGLVDAQPWHCVSISDGHEDADRFEMVGAMLTAHPSGAVRFREEAWTLVTRVPIDPLHKTLVRMCYRLTTELDHGVGGIVDGSESGDLFHRHAQHRLVERKTAKMTDLQRTLLRETGQGELCFLTSM